MKLQNKKILFTACLLLSPVSVFAATIHNQTEKAVPIAADELMIDDSADANKTKKIQAGNLPVSTATQTALNLKANKAATVLLWSEWATGSSFTTASPAVQYGEKLYVCIAPYTKTAGAAPDTLTEYFAEVSGSGGTGDIEGVTAGTGLTGGGASGAVTLSVDPTYVQRRVSASCTAGTSIRAIAEDGTVTCETDDTGSGAVPDGTVNGQVLIWATDQWVVSTAPWLTTAALGTGVETALGNNANAASGVIVLNASAQLPGVSGINLIGSWTGATLTGITTFGPAIQKLGTEIDNMAQISTTVDGYVKVESSAVTVGALPAASDTVAGIIERATTAEAVTGTDTDRAVTPAGLTARLAAPGPIGATPDTGTFTTVTAAEYFVSGTGPFYSILPNNTGTLYTPGTGKTGFTVDDNVLKMFENGGTKYEVLNSNDLIGLSYPVSVSTTTATGNINIDGASADHYYFNNGASTATYTPVITSPPASGKERYIILTVGGGSGVITMTWTNVSWIGTAGAATTTASKYSHYGCIIPSSGNAKCKVIAEAADN